jgi:hypothetical protein
VSTRLGSIGAAVAALLVALALVPGPAQAARTVPRGFFGVMADGPLTNGRTPLDPQLARMRRAGVETLRIVFDWARAQPYATPDDVPPALDYRYPAPTGVPTDFSRMDAVVAAATRHHLAVLPVVMHAPTWAVGGVPRLYGSPPAQPAAYAAFLDLLVHRYGRGGPFWAGRGSARPITAWQVWNEPNVPNEWAADPWPSTYVDLVRAGAAAIHAADPAATVVGAGLTNSGLAPAWVALQRLYDAGGAGLFDAVAVHPYTRDIGGVVKTIRKVRRVMRRHRAMVPILVTELTWSSSGGRTTTGGATWDTTEAGQAKAATRALTVLARKRRELGIRQVDWYTWLSPDVDRGPWFSYAGLNRMHHGRVIGKPALRAYADVARRFAGRRALRARRP